MSKHIFPEANVTNLPPNSPCSGLVTHTGEILITRKSQQKKPEGLFPKGRESEKKTTDQQAAETIGDHKRHLQTCDTGSGQQLAQLGIS
jgi:hypothetical protein